MNYQTNKKVLTNILKGALGSMSGDAQRGAIDAIPKMLESVPNQVNSVKAFMPLSQLTEHADGLIVSARLDLSDALSVHGFIAGELTQNIAGFLLANYTGFGYDIGTDWSKHVNTEDVTILSVSHGYGLGDFLKRAVVANPDSDDGSWPPPPERSPMRTVVRHIEDLKPYAIQVLRDMGRQYCVCEVHGTRYKVPLDILGFEPVETRGNHQFRILKIPQGD